MTSQELLTVTREILERVEYGFIITPSSDGPDARLVKHLEIADDFTIWIGTSAYSRKARQIGAGVAASYAVESKPDFAYVTLKGQAVVVSDVGERTAHWRDGLATFFPGGPVSDEFTLIRLVPRRIELMSFGAKVYPDPVGLVPAALERDGDGWTTVGAERHDDLTT